MADALDRVLACVEARREDAVELLQELVRVNSVNPEFAGVRREDVIGGETRANEILRERYEQAGLETHWVAPDPERRNLVGVRKGRNGGGRSLALNGHVDTVPPVDPDNWVNGSPWNPEIRDERLYGIGSTDMKGSDAAMWLVAQALTDAGIELEGDLLLHSVVGEETMQHELGTSAVLEAGFTADAAIVTEPTSIPHPLTVSPIAAGNWYFRIHVEGRATHCGNRALAIRPGGPGDAIGVNALEKAVKIVVALQELEQQWGLTKSHPYFMPGFFSLLPGVFHADPGSTSPSTSRIVPRSPTRSGIPPDETADEVQGADRGARADRLPPRLVAARPSAALRLDQQLARSLDPMGASRGADDGSVARASQRDDDPATEPAASGRLRRGVRRVVLRGRRHPERRLRSG